VIGQSASQGGGQSTLAAGTVFESTADTFLRIRSDIYMYFFSTEPFGLCVTGACWGPGAGGSCFGCGLGRPVRCSSALGM